MIGNDRTVYSYRGSVSEISTNVHGMTEIVLDDMEDETKSPIRLQVTGALAKYVNDIECTDAEERYLSSDWVYDRQLTLLRIEIPSREIGTPAKVITQTEAYAQAVSIFGAQEYIDRSKPEPMDEAAVKAWQSFRMSQPAEHLHKYGEQSFDGRLAQAIETAEQRKSTRHQPSVGITR